MLLLPPLYAAAMRHDAACWFMMMPCRCHADTPHTLLLICYAMRYARQRCYVADFVAAAMLR